MLAVQRGDDRANLSWSQEELLDWFCQDKEFFESTEVCVFVCVCVCVCVCGSVHPGFKDQCVGFSCSEFADCKYLVSLSCSQMYGRNSRSHETPPKGD